MQRGGNREADDCRAWRPDRSAVARAARVAVALAGVLVLVGCGGYERSWKEAVAVYQAGGVAAPEGPWEGEWLTTNNGHRGRLRAIVTKAPEQPGEYDFHYHATWAEALAGDYRVRFPVTRRGGRWQVDGPHSMGPFGTFRHRATITADCFEAVYSSDRGDVGSFRMGRPAAGGGGR